MLNGRRVFKNLLTLANCSGHCARLPLVGQLRRIVPSPAPSMDNSSWLEISCLGSRRTYAQIKYSYLSCQALRTNDRVVV